MAFSSLGEGEVEDGPSSGFGFDPDSPTVLIHDALTNGQPDPGSAHRARRVRAAIVRLEDSIELRCRDAHPGILHDKDGDVLPIDLLPIDGNLDRAATRAVLDGIRDEVRDEPTTDSRLAMSNPSNGV